MLRSALFVCLLWAGAAPAQFSSTTRPHQQVIQRPWTTETTGYFRIFHHQDVEYGKIVGKYAEQKREELVKRWFGTQPVWRTKCDIYLYDNGHEMAFYTKDMSPWMTAQCHVEYRSGHAHACRIDMRIDRDGCWDDVLVHELMHALLGAELGRSPPRWADEGVAGQGETRLSSWNREMAGRSGFSTKTLMELSDYPKGKDGLDTTNKVQTFYGQSILLTKRMVAMKGEKEFVAFLRTVQKEGPEKALSKHYGMAYKDLDMEWSKEVPVLLVKRTDNDDLVVVGGHFWRPLLLQTVRTALCATVRSALLLPTKRVR
jgi:hypothetical protein